MIEAVRHIGLFEVYHNAKHSEDTLRSWLADGRRLQDLDGLILEAQCKNLLMSAQKLLMAQSVYPNIDKLVITSQTAAPSDDETSYSGTIYTTVAADELARSLSTENPYTVQWNLTTESANGVWGSFVLITSGGVMINRALAGITKLSGQSKIITFTGSVV